METKLDYEYEVALSFAGEDRDFVKKVANILQQNKVKVFYDEYEKVQLWGKDLYSHLDEVYRIKSKYCVLFISKYYKDKLWTNHERESAQAKAFQENKEYILPFKLDDTQIPGIKPTTGYLSLDNTSYEDLANAIIVKLGKFDHQPNAVYKESKLLEVGVIDHNDGRFEIRITKTEFFERRLTDAFPGVRGLRWFDDPKFIVKRFEVLFRKPLKFNLYPGYDEYYGGTSTPIWWYRGGSSMPIDSFELLSDTKCLIGWDELEIKRIAVYRDQSKIKNFIYIETHPETLIASIEDYPDRIVEQQLSYKAFASQEYAIYNDIPIKREEYDDGAAFINGEIVETAGIARVRIRFLTPYNFIICAQSSIYNSREGDLLWGDFLDKSLKGEAILDDWIETIKNLDPQRYGRSEHTWD